MFQAPGSVRRNLAGGSSQEHPNLSALKQQQFIFLFGLGHHALGCPGSSVVKNPPANIGDIGCISGSGRSLGERNDNPIQYSCLNNAWTEEPGRLWYKGLQRVGHD